jgi:aldehyde:ferredoxin oxidoreductase
MEYLSAGKILVVDLGTSAVAEETLEESLVAEKIGGAAINRYLFEKHAAADPIVIGTGLLTGSLYPGACAAVITAKSPVSGKLCHCPITFKVGLEIKFSGFDHIVITGTSAKPVFLWVHDGIGDITDAADVWGQDVWATTDAWRRAMGDDLIQTMVIGKAGEARLDYAQVSLNYWASSDRFGFGKLFGLKNLKGLAFRGMGLLEIADAEEFIELSLDMLEDLKESACMDKQGIADICSAIGENGVQEWLGPIVHRHSACYNTPYPTNTFVYLDEDPQKMMETDVAEPGFLVSDIFGLLGFHKIGLSAADACRLLKTCAQSGLDAVAVAELSRAAGKTTMHDIQAALFNLSGRATPPGRGIFSPWCPIQPVFGTFAAVEPDVDGWWERRMAVASIFGIHPLLAVMAPELTEDDLLETASVGTGIELGPDRLEAVIQYLLQS